MMSFQVASLTSRLSSRTQFKKLLQWKTLSGCGEVRIYFQLVLNMQIEKYVK